MAVPPPFPPHPDKRALRADFRERRLRFAEAHAASAAAALRARLAAALARGGVLAGYLAMRGEPDVLPILLQAYGAGTAIALPQLLPGEPMRFVAWSPGAPLARGPLGILQPAEGEEVIPDTLVMPLVAFDRAGRRLGQGAGHYDRWLGEHPHAWRVGAAWSVQEMDEVPTDPWDVTLHAIATEREWIAA